MYSEKSAVPTDVTLRLVLAAIVAVKKAISVTYSECVSVALGIENAMRVPHIDICGMSGCTIFFFFQNYLINDTIFEEKKRFYIKCVFGFLYYFCLKHFSLEKE